MERQISVIRSVDVLIFLRYTPSKRSVLLWVEKFMTSSMTWQNVYEYWNELLNLADTEENQKAFVEACRDGKMTSLFHNSEYLIIERLLNFHEYDLAELYLKKHEKTGERGFRIKKYKAIILQGKKNDVEALKWYRAAYEDDSSDAFVIDSLITLSLLNKRKVSKEVLGAAIKKDTSRLHMLAAAWKYQRKMMLPSKKYIRCGMIC